MQLDGWCFYEERLSGRRIFHPRKRSFVGPMLTFACAVLVLVAVSHF